MLKKKVLVASLGAVLAASTFSNSYAAVFSDTTNSWTKDYVDWASNKNLVIGYSDSSFKPNAYVTKAEFYKMVNRLMGYSKKAPLSFSDVGVGNWYYEEVALGVYAGYISDSRGNLNPNEPISRDEVARILAYIYGLGNNSSLAEIFSDSALITNKGAVGALVGKKVLNGYPDRTFKPQAAVKRGEIAKILYCSNKNIAEVKEEAKKPSYSPYYYGYYGATAAELNALKSAIADGKVVLANAEDKYIFTQTSKADLEKAVKDGETAYNNAYNGYYYNGKYYYNGYYYNGYHYDGYYNNGFVTLDDARHFIENQGITYDASYVERASNGYYYLTTKFENIYGSRYGYYYYPEYYRNWTWYTNFDTFYDNYKAYFNYDRDYAYKVWSNNGYYYNGWYGYGSDYVNAARKAIEKAIANVAKKPEVTPEQLEAKKTEGKAAIEGITKLDQTDAEGYKTKIANAASPEEVEQLVAQAKQKVQELETAIASAKQAITSFKAKFTKEINDTNYEGNVDAVKAAITALEGYNFETVTTSATNDINNAVATLNTALENFKEKSTTPATGENSGATESQGNSYTETGAAEGAGSTGQTNNQENTQGPDASAGSQTSDTETQPQG